MLEHDFLFRHHKGENRHLQQAESFAAVLGAAADHVEFNASSVCPTYVSELCCSARFAAELFSANVHNATATRALNKEQFRMAVIENISGCMPLAELLLVELRELELRDSRLRKRETAAKRHKKAPSAVILPFRPRPV